MWNKITKEVRDFGALGPLAIHTYLGPIVGAIVIVGTAHLWMDPFFAMGAWRVPVYLAVTILATGFAIAPTHAFAIIAGMTFGWGWGVLWCWFATGIAAWFGFVWMRKFGHAKLARYLRDRPRATAVHSALTSEGALRTIPLLALIRVSVATSFAATNLLMATTPVKMSTYMAGSLLGMAPKTLVVVGLGATLQNVDFSKPEDMRLLVLGVVSTLLVLWWIGRIARRTLAAI